jgi:hypothetical protein
MMNHTADQGAVDNESRQSEQGEARGGAGGGRGGDVEMGDDWTSRSGVMDGRAEGAGAGGGVPGAGVGPAEGSMELDRQ